MRNRLSTATTIACVALFFTLTGAGLAASRYIVTSKSEIAPSALKAARSPAGTSAGAASIFSSNDLVVVDGLGKFMASGGTVTARAVCPKGDFVVSGGWAGPLQDTVVDYNQPEGSRGWEVVASNDSQIEGAIQAVAVCAP